MGISKSKYHFWILLCLVIFSGCEGFFGTKTDLDFIDKPEFQVRTISYVPIQPVLEQFQRPVDVITGFDELIYVVDEASEEIIALDESGRELARRYVKGVTSIAQDRKFDILAIGRKTDTISSIEYELTCIYRFDLHGTDGYGLQHAQLVNTVVHPFYYKSTFSSTDKDVVLNDIGILADNKYYVTRNGEASNSLSGPDDAVLLFGADDVFITPIAVTSGGSLFREYFKKPFAITTNIQPPQISAFGNDEFMYTSVDPNGVIKVQYIEIIESEFGSIYQPKLYVVEDTTKAEGFLTYPLRFGKPSGMTIAGDASRHIFVSDAEKDSIYLFSSNGYEGTKPPPAYPTSKYVNVSFGGFGKSLVEFNEPMGLAYKNEILYVADAGNGRVLRFKLTTDFD
jgi:hypothetical protein